MRATAQDQQAAQLMGVDLNQTIAMTFLIGGALAGAAGVFQGQYFGFVRFDLGFNAGLKAFTAAVLGGIGNLTGAAIGGFVIAFIEVFAAAVGQARWSQAIVFVVLIARPRLPARPASSASRSENGHDRRAAVAPERASLTVELRTQSPTSTARRRSSSAMAIVGRRCIRCSSTVPPFSVFQPAERRGSTASRTPACSSCWRSA